MPAYPPLTSPETSPHPLYLPPFSPGYLHTSSFHPSAPSRPSRPAAILDTRYISLLSTIFILIRLIICLYNSSRRRPRAPPGGVCPCSGSTPPPRSLRGVGCRGDASVPRPTPLQSSLSVFNLYVQSSATFFYISLYFAESGEHCQCDLLWMCLLILFSSHLSFLRRVMTELKLECCIRLYATSH